MIIQFRSLMGKQDPIKIEEQIDMSELLKTRMDIKEAEPIKVNLKASSAPEAETVHVVGQCSTSIEFICSRCLSPYKQHLHIPFDEKFSQKAEVVEADDEDHIHLISEDKIDLVPIVEENVLLALPFIPLCDEACEGLCPVCGQNKNEQSCDCKQEKIDPRLVGLKEFFDE